LTDGKSIGSSSDIPKSNNEEIGDLMMKRSAMNLWIVLIAAAFLASCGKREADEVQPSEAESPSTEAPRTIAEKLTERREASRARVSAETLQIMSDATETLRESGIVEGALNVGDKIPKFVLNDAMGNPVNIEDLLADGPLVITFYRGGW
jgi:hypothetical protein